MTTYIEQRSQADPLAIHITETDRWIRPKDQAEAIMAKASADAAIVGFENEADAAGWKKAVEALGNDGEAFARYTLYQKLAPGYRSIMTNTADSPLMDVFRSFTEPSQPKADSPEAPKE